MDQVFAAFEPFARYGFNKAHATCYGLIAYQTAYLKANYPVEFMTAVLNGFRERSEKVAAVVAECRRLGIEVRPPDVQKSQTLFTVETDADGTSAIRFGLIAVKNVGEGAIEVIVAAREGRAPTAEGAFVPGTIEAGPFASLDDLCRRVDLRTVNKRVLESLIKAGALASIGAPGRCWPGWTWRSRRARGTSATWRRGRARSSTCSRCPRRHRRPPSPRRPETRCRAASGCAGRRSCWACT